MQNTHADYMLLPENQKEVLKKTIVLFESIAELISTGVFLPRSLPEAYAESVRESVEKNCTTFCVVPSTKKEVEETTGCKDSAVLVSIINKAAGFDIKNERITVYSGSQLLKLLA